MVLSPMPIIYYSGTVNMAWVYFIVIIYYIAISTLPIYLHHYFLPKFLKKSKYCLIMAIVLTAAVHIIFTILGYNLIGEIVRGIGEGTQYLMPNFRK